jgi:hypothetical protein
MMTSIVYQYGNEHRFTWPGTPAGPVTVSAGDSDRSGAPVLRWSRLSGGGCSQLSVGVFQAMPALEEYHGLVSSLREFILLGGNGIIGSAVGVLQAMPARRSIMDSFPGPGLTASAAVSGSCSRSCGSYYAMLV